MRDSEFSKALQEAGCTNERVKEITLMYEHGANADALKKLKCCRCEQLGTVHNEQRKIDLYDYLIELLKKNIENSDKAAGQ